MSELLTVEDVAKMCKVTPLTVRRWKADNLIDFVKLPKGGIRFRPENIDKWLERRTIKATKKLHNVHSLYYT